MSARKPIYLRSPEGLRITGVLQHGTGISGIEEVVYPPLDGLYDVEWNGVTEWEEQVDALNDNLERVFIDEGGNEWPESELIALSVDPENQNEA